MYTKLTILSTNKHCEGYRSSKSWMSLM